VILKENSPRRAIGDEYAASDEAVEQGLHATYLRPVFRGQVTWVKGRVTCWSQR
ncbi:unnamed protein product, partial [marine sediment metagenome]